MSIFNLYPKTNYYISDYDFLKVVDISTSLRIKSIMKGYVGILSTPYVVQDGERPDQVSYAVYGNPYYDWIILLANEIYSIYDDWPKSTSVLQNYVIQKYGSLEKAQNIVRYYNKYGDTINFYEYNLMSVAEKNLSRIENAYEFEIRTNINKSKIKVIRPDAILKIESDLKSTIELAIE